MFDRNLRRLEKAQREAEQMLAEGYARSLPIGFAVFAIQAMLRRRRLPVPDDLLAWASKGAIFDAMVAHPLSPDSNW